MRVLFVCSGNICRSPTAEAVFRALLEERGLEGQVEVDSAGTGSWHVGAAPDERSARAAAARGIELRGRARQVEPTDFEEFDLLVAMDAGHAAELRALAPDEPAVAKVHLLREYDAEAVAAGDTDVPDPYYDGAEGFELVLDMVDRGARGLIAEVQATS